MEEVSADYDYLLKKRSVDYTKAPIGKLSSYRVLFYGKKYGEYTVILNRQRFRKGKYRLGM